VVFDDAAALEAWRRDSTHVAAKRRRAEVYAWHSTEVLVPLEAPRSWTASDADA
jgi:hypothetical protein